MTHQALSCVYNSYICRGTYYIYEYEAGKNVGAGRAGYQRSRGLQQTCGNDPIVVVGSTGRPRAFVWAARRCWKGAGLENDLFVRAAMRLAVAVLAVTLAPNAVQALS